MLGSDEKQGPTKVTAKATPQGDRRLRARLKKNRAVEKKSSIEREDITLK